MPAGRAFNEKELNVKLLNQEDLSEVLVHEGSPEGRKQSV